MKPAYYVFKKDFYCSGLVLENTKNINNISDTRVKVIGFGNKFLSDDSIGPIIIEKLEKSSFSEDKTIEIIDLGTSGSDLIFHIRECPRIIIIDALDAGQDPGKVIRIKEKDIEQFCNEGLSSFSLHDLNLADILKLTRAMKLKTDITIIGINPLNIEFGEELSPEIQEKIPEIISLVEKTLMDHINTDNKNLPNK
ncbi:hydrogenase maturation protease [Actinomycetota bacterium]